MTLTVIGGVLGALAGFALGFAIGVLTLGIGSAFSATAGAVIGFKVAMLITSEIALLSLGTSLIGGTIGHKKGSEREKEYHKKEDVQLSGDYKDGKMNLYGALYRHPTKPVAPEADPSLSESSPLLASMHS